MAQGPSQTAQDGIGLNLLTLLLSIVATCIVFRGIFSGNIIANCVHLFHFEPWVHHASKLDNTESSNHILSDSVDGPDANLNPANVQPFSIAKYLQVNHAIGRVLRSQLSWYQGASYDCLIIFTLMLFFMHLYLRSIGVRWPLAFAVAVGFTFGSTNMHLHVGWAYETACAVITLYFLERLFQRNRWSDTIWLIFALVNLGGCTMVHIVVFYSSVLVMYGLGRTAISSNRGALLVKCTCSGFAALLLSADYLWPTINYYSDYFEKGYRENFGLRQNLSHTIVTFLFANFYGHPLSESQRWSSHTYINTAMFVGSSTALAALTGGLIRGFTKRDFFSIFFIVACLFGIGYVYELPFERIEAYVASLPLLKWAPAMYFKSVLHLLVSVLGALGLQYLSTNCSRIVSLACGCGMLIAIWLGLDVVHFIHSKHTTESSYLSWYMTFARATAIGSAVLVTLLSLHSRLLSPWRQRAAGILCTALLITISGETLVHSSGWIPYSKPEHCFARTETTDFLVKRVGNGRIMGLGHAAVPSMINHLGYGVEMAAGRMSVKAPYLLLLRQADNNAYQSHPTQYLFSTDTDLQKPVWDLANVRFFVASRSVDPQLISSRYAPGSVKVHVLSDGIIFERRPPPAHAYLINRAVIFNSPTEMASSVEHDWNVRQTIALESPDDLIPPTTEQSSATMDRSRVLAVRKGINRIEIDYKSPEDSYLLLSELYHPYWKAYLQDRKLATFRAYFFLMGVKAPKGHHSITLQYELPGLRTANCVVAATLALMIALVVISYRRKRS
jgi:hypothetical protein